jgi:hypothetical protein
MSELAHLRGVLNQVDLNRVQEAMLSVVTRRKREEEIEVETAKFEQTMFVNNPSLYKEYIDNKKQEEIDGNKDVQWMAPSSIEEAAELVSMFSDIDKQLKEMDDEPTPQLDFLSALGGINLDEIGGDD